MRSVSLERGRRATARIATRLKKISPLELVETGLARAPEPGSLALLAVGLMGVIVVARKRSGAA